MILVDTSAWIGFFRNSPKIANLVDGLLESNEVALCGPVMTEILRGFTSEKDKKRAAPLFLGCHYLTQPHDLWREAGDLGAFLRGRGKTVKTIDLLIAVHALVHAAPILTLDSDFTLIKDCGVPLLLYN